MKILKDADLPEYSKEDNAELLDLTDKGGSESSSDESMEDATLYNETEVRERYKHWNKEQDLQLQTLVQEHGFESMAIVSQKLNEYIDKQNDWTNIDHSQLKKQEACADRWLFLNNQATDGSIKHVKGNWSPEEDLILKEKVSQFGLKKWKEIATFLPGRIGKQCRERWYNNVDPKLNKDKWTLSEDIQLMELHKEYGNRWVQIQKFMPGRIDNDIKNRFNASLKKYSTFDEYLESIDKKKDKLKKKILWKQHMKNYELRNANLAKRYPISKDKDTSGDRKESGDKNQTFKAKLRYLKRGMN